MISCTEFIPAYSELFAFLEDSYGRNEVDRLWNYLFQPDGKGIPLINFVKKEGIRGCFSYWAGSLNEEAADFSMYVNEKRGYFLVNMHSCPSKGRLLVLKEEIGITPYHDYCLHCDSYRTAVEAIGLKYIYNFQGIDHASCSILVYDPEKFDGRVIIDEETEIMERKASDNEYFHKDFHSSMNMGIQYVGETHGEEAIKRYLEQFTEHVYRNQINVVKEQGLLALEKMILATYTKEKAEDAIETMLAKDENELLVKVLYCPAVQHLHQTGRMVSKWFHLTTETVMQTLAKTTNYNFEMIQYDENTGSASYRFYK